jgi:DNA-binding response OmpR family regulator
MGYVLNTEPNRIYSHSGFTYYPEDKYVVLANGKEYRLDKHKQENLILELLTESPGKIVREGVLEKALDDLGANELNLDGPLKKYMFRLRRKIEPNGRRSNFRYIIYERGIGYKLIDPGRIGNLPITVFEKTLSA